MTCNECSEFLEHLADFLDRNADVHIPNWCQEHLRHCRRCACVLRTTQKTIELYRECDPPAIPDEVRRRIQAAFSASHRL